MGPAQSKKETVKQQTEAVKGEPRSCSLTDKSARELRDRVREMRASLERQGRERAEKNINVNEWARKIIAENEKKA